MHETSGIIRKIADKGAEGVLVSLMGHDGYFRIPSGAAQADLLKKIEDAKTAETPICLVHDAALSIISLK